MYEPTQTEEESKSKGLSLRKSLGKVFRGAYDIIETLVIAAAIVVFIYLFVASPHEVLGRSMEDNFWDGEYLLADKVSYHISDPKRGDVVIFEQTDTADYIKRVIGLPGDTVELRDGHFYINGELLDEREYLGEDIYTDQGNYLVEGEIITIKEGTYFVAGDNRPHSSDSRSFGPIDEGKIRGRAILIYWPFSHLKTVPRPSYNE